jgi:tRNA(fMet)-specific endonuclease VapC
VEGGAGGAQARLSELVERGEPLFTTRFNVAELHVGVHRSDNPAKERKRVDAVLDVFGVLEFDDAAAQLFGQITAHLQASGRPAGDMDVLIAATAMASGQCLVTANPAHFGDIPQFDVEAH